MFSEKLYNIFKRFTQLSNYFSCAACQDQYSVAQLMLWRNSEEGGINRSIAYESCVCTLAILQLSQTSMHMCRGTGRNLKLEQL